MKKYEYEISLYPSSQFKHLAFFCSSDGSCNLEEIPDDQVDKLSEILTERGVSGWELIQIQFGANGVVAFWKREVITIGSSLEHAGER